MELQDLQLNDRAMEVANEVVEWAEEINVAIHSVAEASVIDCGVEIAGSLAAGRYLAEICLADMARVETTMERLGRSPCLRVFVETQEPAVACLMSQYAGWRLSEKKFFAMTSGPIRAILADEPVFKRLEYKEDSEVAVAVMEARGLPPESVVERMIKEADVDAENLMILVAPTASMAGGFQVVARSVETCLHKLFELQFDVTCIRSAAGSAFLPPIAKNDLVAIGRTNDSILYGAEVCLWVETEDELIAEVGPRLTASASTEYGRPFAELFERAGGDFYKIDPMLFSPALVSINNLSTGSTFLFGKTDYELVAKSFYGA